MANPFEVDFNKDESGYLNLLEYVYTFGEVREDRTGVGTRSTFVPLSLRYSLLNNTFPLITTKQVSARIGIGEILFFACGKRQTKELEAKNINIWKLNSSKAFQAKRGLSHYEEGDIGFLYGPQWRNFNGTETKKGIDQLSNALNLIKNDSYSRRIIVTAYNPEQAHLGVLEPCHTFFQFYVSENKYLSCHLFMRSNDLFLGHVHNISGYSLLTHLMAKAANLEAKELIYTCSDCHIYLNHLEQVKEQISRTPYPFPKIQILKEINSISDIEKLSYEDIKIIDYKHHPKISANMAV